MSAPGKKTNKQTNKQKNCNRYPAIILFDVAMLFL